MKPRYVIVSVVVAFIVGLLIGVHLGVRHARRFVDQLRAELISSHPVTRYKDVVNMPAAIAQVRASAKRLGLEIRDVSALDAHSVQLHMADGPEVRLRWEGMGEDTARSRTDLDRQLQRLTVALKKANDVRAPVHSVDMAQ